MDNSLLDLCGAIVVSTSFVDAPDLTDRFVEQFHALERELMELKKDSQAHPTVSSDEIHALQRERDALSQERDGLRQERDHAILERDHAILERDRAKLELRDRCESLCAERDEAIAKQNHWKEQWGYAKGRAEELERTLEKSRPLAIEATRQDRSPPTTSALATAELHQRIQLLEQERNNWRREYERCLDENEALRGH